MNNKTGFGPVMGTDMLGRKLPSAKETGKIKTDKERQVGMFYFLVNALEKRQIPMVIPEIVKKYPEAVNDENHPGWGKMPISYHWGKPFWDFYYSDDEWVIRKHLEMLTLAGVDFLFLDTTNGHYFERIAKMIMRILNQYNEMGWNAPKVMFYTNARSGEEIQEIYENIYKENYMPSTWLCIDGKPAIIGHPEQCSDEVKEFFKVMHSQWPIEPDKVGGWPWMDFKRPQMMYAEEDGKNSVVSVSVAQHPKIYMGDSLMYGEKGNRGRSFHNGIDETENDENAILYGYNVAEQWEVARKYDPDFVMVTGWNEWTAGKWDYDPPRKNGRVVNFVDLSSPEFSRDMDLMEGGYFDNYYMQLIGDIRKYKGCEEIPKQEMKTVEINKDFHQWKDVSVVYRNFEGARIRYCEGFGGIKTNFTVRNNIVESKVAYDDENIYFYVRTETTTTPYFSGGSWMNLFIKTTEREGFDFIVNYKPKDENKTEVIACDETGFKGESIGRVSYYRHNDLMHIAVPRKMLGLEKEKPTFMFKWGDSSEPYTCTEDLYMNGNTAPLGRVCYVFKGKK